MSQFLDVESRGFLFWDPIMELKTGFPTKNNVIAKDIICSKDTNSAVYKLIM